MEHVEETSERRGDGYVNLALLTDGLRAEREQGITIDVAYRSFVTERRRFQLADAPGHVQYTRNMVTGASTADVAVVLLDARKGVIEQTRRHASIVQLLGVPHVVFAREQDGPRRLRRRALPRDRGRAARARRPDGHRATRSRSRSQRSTATTSSSARSGCHGGRAGRCSTTWRRSRSRVTGTPLTGASRCSGSSGRCPRSTTTTAATPGQVAGGEWRAGDEVVVLPSGLRTRVAAVETADGPLDVGGAGHVGHRAPRGRPRRATRRDARRPRTTSRSRPARSRRPSAG